MDEILKYLPLEERNLLQRAPFPEWISPMLATLTKDRFSDPNWLYETKFNGERALTFYNGKNIKILSRNKQNLNKIYPELVEAYKHLLCDDFVVDGEIVTFVNNVTSFSRLQQRPGMKEVSLNNALEVPVYYYIFDILHVNGHDITKLPLRSRKLLLRKALLYTDSLRFTEGILEEGENYYKKACKNAWEGVIAKNLESPYQSSRSRDWLKFKCDSS
jgi:ATP-dependent DNA ligase